MTHADWLQLMQFPPEWAAWDLLPPELAEEQLRGYRPGHEDAPEHDRHSAFQWWLRQSPGPEILTKLARLSWLDPDPPMAEYVRQCIATHPQCTAEVGAALVDPEAQA